LIGRINNGTDESIITENNVKVILKKIIITRWVLSSQAFILII